MAHRPKKYAASFKLKRHTEINKLIDSGDAGASAAKREAIKRETGACRKPQSLDKQYWCPNGHNMARP